FSGGGLGCSRTATLCGVRRQCRGEHFLPLNQGNLDHNRGSRRFAWLNAEDAAQFANPLAHSAESNPHTGAAVAERSNAFERNAFSEVAHMKRNRVRIVENVDIYFLALGMAMNVGKAFLKNSE